MADETTIQKGVLRVCCADERNLVPHRMGDRTDLIVRICRECDRRHFELSVDPGMLGLRGGSLGA